MQNHAYRLLEDHYENTDDETLCHTDLDFAQCTFQWDELLLQQYRVGWFTITWRSNSTDEQKAKIALSHLNIMIWVICQ